MIFTLSFGFKTYEYNHFLGQQNLTNVFFCWACWRWSMTKHVGLNDNTSEWNCLFSEQRLGLNWFLFYSQYLDCFFLCLCFLSTAAAVSGSITGTFNGRPLFLRPFWQKYVCGHKYVCRVFSYFLLKLLIYFRWMFSHLLYK